MTFASKLASASAVVLLVGATGASAASLQLGNISFNWNTVVGGQNIENTGTGNPAQIRWGGDNDTFDQKSGYNISALDPAPQPAVDVNSLFDLATFQHVNQTIPTGTAIDSVNLTVMGNILIDSMNEGAVAFNFLFDHTETPNACIPAGCADDIVEVTLLNFSDTIDVGGVLYTLDIEGFFQNGVLNDTFISPEGGTNTGIVKAIFTSEIPNQVPLPAAGWLLIGGLGGLAALRRRKKAA